MDRNILKKTLHEQATPMAEAVKNKLAYLQGDDVFLNSDEQHSEPLFTDLLMTQGQPKKMPTKPVEPQSTADKVAVHKQSVAAKIAALRGVSTMPGEYLNRKF